ncbi:MAG: hypothetical protein ACE5H2_02145 [Terriglobia bacterium]
MSPRPSSGQADERRFYDERRETKPAQFVCPFCRQSASYQVGWLVRQKKARSEGRLSQEDQQRFAKARSYMVRTEDLLVCQNPRCRKRFEIPTLQSVVLL